MLTNDMHNQFVKYQFKLNLHVQNERKRGKE